MRNLPSIKAGLRSGFFYLGTSRCVWAFGAFASLLTGAHGQEPALVAAVHGQPLRVPATGAPGFTRLPDSHTGLRFTNVLDRMLSGANRILENGSGVATGDYDNDGWIDVLLCGLSGNSALFRNQGNWHFEDVTAAAGLQLSGVQARGAVLADINSDHSLDLLISTLNTGVLCFTNNRAGMFNLAFRLASNLGCTTMALADVDGNRTLDLFVATYRADDIRDRARIEIQRVGGKVSVAPWLQDRIALTEKGLIEFGDPDLLYLNDGHGRLTEFAQSGKRFHDENGTPVAGPARDWGLSAAFRDLNNDGWPDLYVCNDYWTPDRLWLNKNGDFHAAPKHSLRHTSENSMGVDFADLNHDGFADFFVTDMLSRDRARRKRQMIAQAQLGSAPGEIASRPQYMQNMLFVSNGDGTYAEIANYSGVSASDWSWQPYLADLDLDGHADLLIPTGHSRDVQDLDALSRIQSLQHPWPKGMDPQEMQEQFTREMIEHGKLYPTYLSEIVIFRNRGDLTFEEMTTQWGTDQRAVHQGLALGDFDQDGDLDFVVNNLNSAAGIYRNECSAPRISVRLRGASFNTAAVGARVSLLGPNIPAQTHEVVSGGKYLSGSDTLLVFATAGQTNNIRLRVTWRTGQETVVDDLRPNRLYEITEPN